MISTFRVSTDGRSKKSQQAKQFLDSNTDVDDSEKEYLLDCYSLVREGKLNYVSTIAFKAITGNEPTDLPEFFRTYDSEFKPKYVFIFSLPRGLTRRNQTQTLEKGFAHEVMNIFTNLHAILVRRSSRPETLSMFNNCFVYNTKVLPQIPQGCDGVP